MGRFTMTRANVSLTALSLVVLLLIGMAAAQCGRGTPRGTVAVVVVDTVGPDTGALKKFAAPRRRVKKKHSGDSVAPRKPRRPSSRDYLDDRLN